LNEKASLPAESSEEDKHTRQTGSLLGTEVPCFLPPENNKVIAPRVPNFPTTSQPTLAESIKRNFNNQHFLIFKKIPAFAAKSATESAKIAG
jgi:hypothetical protein